MIGGGNTAVEEALFLTNFATKVTVVHRRDSFRAEKILQDRLFKNPKISVVWDSVLDDVTGDASPLKVRGVGAAQRRRPARVTEVPADGVFIAIGHTPASALFEGQVEMKGGGYIKTAPYSTATSVRRRVRRRRRDRRHLPAGGDRRRPGLHGGAGIGKISRRAWRSRAAGRGGVNPFPWVRGSPDREREGLKRWTGTS